MAGQEVAMAETETTPTRLPRLNEPAPDFTANSTHGPLTMSQFRGRWVVLFSHPADFTPVCTTEFVEFARNTPRFKSLNTQLIGLSIDSVFSHIAWVRKIEEMFSVKVEFPVIADLDMKVANLYGMVHQGASDTSTVRAVFVIDDKGNVRAMIYYPLSNGRSIQEVLRIVEALQTTDKNGIATPCEWKPGEKVIVPPPKTQADAEKRLGEAGIEAREWWFSTKKL
jgi:peroxiredoxin (alkyl hydroperoxide reductase subunit C)